MPQMLLDSPEIAARSGQKLDAARMAEGHPEGVGDETRDQHERP